MKVFLSWSGFASRAVASALYEWMPNVINAIEPWMSSKDIDAGAVGLEEIAQQLNGTTFGVVCLTQENKDRPWINYEAGALSKEVTGQPRPRVATVLIDIENPGSISGPIGRYQATRLDDQEQVIALMQSINKHGAQGGPGLLRSEQAVRNMAVRLWPDLLDLLAAKRDELLVGPTQPSDPVPDRVLLTEILEVVRGLAEVIPSTAPAALPPPGPPNRTRRRVTDTADLIARYPAVADAAARIAGVSGLAAQILADSGTDRALDALRDAAISQIVWTGSSVPPQVAIQPHPSSGPLPTAAEEDVDDPEDGQSA